MSPTNHQTCELNRAGSVVWDRLRKYLRSCYCDCVHGRWWVAAVDCCACRRVLDPVTQLVDYNVLCAICTHQPEQQAGEQAGEQAGGNIDSSGAAPA